MHEPQWGVNFLNWVYPATPIFKQTHMFPPPAGQMLKLILTARSYSWDGRQRVSWSGPWRPCYLHKARHGCFLKWGYPEIIHFVRIFPYKPFILGTTISRNPIGMNASTLCTYDTILMMKVRIQGYPSRPLTKILLLDMWLGHQNISKQHSCPKPPSQETMALCLICSRKKSSHFSMFQLETKLPPTYELVTCS